MSEIIDRVAQAIWDCHEDEDCPRYIDLSPVARQRAQDWARAGIKALREATDEMVVAMECAVPQLSSFKDREDSPSFIAWQAGIEEAIR